MKHRLGWIGFAVLAFTCGAAVADAPTATVTKRVPWSATGATLRPAGKEHAALGPSAITVDAQGRPLVLDSWGARILDGDGAVIATIGADSADLVNYADGAFAIYRPLSRSVDLHSPRGEHDKTGTLSIPRSVTDVAWLEAGPSHRVVVTNPFQESVMLGSPSAPLDEASVLRSRHEGVFGDLEVLGDRHGAANLRVVATNKNDRKRIVHEWPIGEGAAQIVGRDGDVACVRLEHVHDGREVVVARDVVCLDVNTGNVRMRTKLPLRGVYVPRRELALGGGMLWLMHPEADGLALYGWAVAR